MTKTAVRSVVRAALAAMALAGSAVAGAPTETLTAPGVGPMAIYAPAGAPRSVVLFVSGDGGWNLGVIPMAERLRVLGALVAGIDIRYFMKNLESMEPCAYPAGTLEEASRTIQLRRKLDAYQRPILVGYSSGATLVYAALAAAPPETFAGAVSLGFCPDIEIKNTPCRTRGLVPSRRAKGPGYDLAPFPDLAVPWMVLQGEIDQVCSPAATREFVSQIASARLFSLPGVGHGFSVTRNWDAAYATAYQAVVEHEEKRKHEEPRAPNEPALEGLPLVEVPAATAEGDAFAVLLTGDGGWADIDKELGRLLSAQGVGVVGWNSLRYYWTPRNPETAAADFTRLIEHYAAAWRRRRVVLVGYSFGADVLPFLVNRLPLATAARIDRVVLLGLSGNAAFEFHVSSWLGGGADSRYPTRPEVERMKAPVLCVHGADEKDSACAALGGRHVRSVAVGGGHHFGGDYPRIVRLILGRENE